MATIDYSSGSRIATEGAHAVYTKAAWADAWTLQPNMACIECQWNAAPNFNTAILRWDLGSIILPGDTSPTVFGVWVGRGQFVRVDWTCDDSSILTWVGFIDSSEWPTEAFGTQQLIAYGLDRALALTPITDAVWRDEDGMGDPLVRRSPVPPVFGGEKGVSGRRSEQVTETSGDTYAFARFDDTLSEAWSTREIVRYLMRYHLPTNNSGVADIPWAIQQIDQLPDWDTPTVETRNRTLWDVLTELVSPEKQLGFTVGSDGTAVYLRCFTHLQTALTVQSKTLAANPTQHTIIFAPDALTDGRVSDTGGTYDQVICRGGRRKTICTLNNLVANWSSTIEDEYELGASTDPDYATLGDDQKKQHDAAARSLPRLQPVFRTLKIPDDWDYQIDATDVFEGNQHPRNVELLARLPVKQDANWSGAINTDHFERDQNGGQPILVVWDDPSDTQSWIDNAALSGLSGQLMSQLDFAVQPTVRERKLDLNVVGGPQHLIADGTFTGLAADDIAPVLDYRTVNVTVALEEDRFCEASYPSSPATADVVRRLVVDVGDEYQQVSVLAGTVTEVSDFAGNLKTSDGGYLVDDTDELSAIAEIVGRGVLSSRKSTRWSSLRKVSSIAVGDLIVTAGGATIAAPVESVRMQGGVSVNTPAKATRQSFATYQGRFDGLGMLRRMGVTASAALADSDPMKAVREKQAAKRSDRLRRRSYARRLARRSP